MNKLVKEAIERATALKKTPDSVAWKDDVPWPQPYHVWNADKNEWQPVTASSSGSTKASQTNISKIVVYSWNIDFMLPFPTPRMDAALNYLHSQIQENNELQPISTVVIINLQECVPSDLIAISQKQWVRENFYITDLDSSNWASGMYGTVTLVDRRLEVSACFRVHFSKTRMERDALFVDVSAATQSGTTKGPVIRIGNSHLESLALDPPLRPAQMQLIASQMHAQENNNNNVAGAVVTGDFNAIQPFDLTLHSDNGLKDAYLELGGVENSDDGYTWGQQALSELRKLYGCSRMDKAYYCGEGIKLLKFERIGADVEIAEEEQEQREQLVGLGFEKPWVTDHLGIKAVFELASD